MRTALVITYIMIGVGFEGGMKDHPTQSTEATAARVLIWPIGAGYLIAEAREYLKNQRHD